MAQDTRYYGAAGIIGELEIITQVWILFRYQKITQWRKNFFISLFIASILYWFYPNMTWAWGIVLSFSVFSLLTSSIIHFFVQKKLKQIYQQIECLKHL